MKKITGLILGIFSPFFFATPAFAVTPTPVPEQIAICPTGQFAPLCQFTQSKFGEIIGNLITLALIVAVVIGLFFLIYGGIRWIISGGDKTAVESARNTIVAAIVGLVVAFLAFFIVSLVFNLFGLNITSLTLPTLLQTR